jgi:hypothetical protein
MDMEHTAHTLEVETTREEKAAAMLAYQSSHTQNLAAVLVNGANWTYDGVCNDRGRADGTCACGHAGIRYEFTLTHKTEPRSVVVGSTCVTTFHGVSAEVVARIQADLAKLIEAAKERERQAKAAAEALEVQKALAAWSEAEYQADQLAANWMRNHPGQYKPYPVYKRSCAPERLAARSAGKLHPYIRVPALKTAKGQLRVINNKLANAKATAEEIRQAE